MIIVNPEMHDFNFKKALTSFKNFFFGGEGALHKIYVNPYVFRTIYVYKSDM